MPIIDFMEYLSTEVLVVGGGTGATAAAIQAARQGANVILVSEFEWLGGMLTSAGVCAPDGNELASFQTGLWGAFLRELEVRQPGGLDHGWVSFFTYHPRVGAAIFEDWVKALPNLHWIQGQGQVPLAVERTGDRLSAVTFADYHIEAQVILDGTELGDLLALGDVPHRWGWEWQSEFQEPSAPAGPNALTNAYPVQTPTWVVMLKDAGEGAVCPTIEPTPLDDEAAFEGAWEGYGPESFLNYGRLPGDRFMINWPQQGNDYGRDLARLIGSPDQRHDWLQEARWYTQSFARYIQTHLGPRYGLAEDMFPQPASSTGNGLGGGAFALHPYFRESRRLQGLITVTERDVLPQTGGTVAPLPVDASGRSDAIAIGNYPNDHHYPTPESALLQLAPKSIRWGGRWTGTPFTIPYRSLVPATVDGLLVCEKNISVSHIANGATRLQPVVLGIGQAAGAAAALCVQKRCQPRELSVKAVQEALLTDAIAPAALVPGFNLLPQHPHWLQQQRAYLEHPDQYPLNGYSPSENWDTVAVAPSTQSPCPQFKGIVQSAEPQNYTLQILEPAPWKDRVVQLVTLHASVDSALAQLKPLQELTLWGRINPAGNWLRVERFEADA